MEIITWRKLLIFMTGVFSHISNQVFNISTLAFSLWNKTYYNISDL